jgi:hypothetical protein
LPKKQANKKEPADRRLFIFLSNVSSRQFGERVRPDWPRSIGVACALDFCSELFWVRKLFCTAFGFGCGRAPAAGFGAGGVLDD